MRAFFSGDYQEDSLFYACDAVKDQEAELAVIDCAHNHINSPARELRENITARVSRSLAEGRNVIFPVPQYGRGLELFYMLKQAFPQAAVCVDQRLCRLRRGNVERDLVVSRRTIKSDAACACRYMC